MGEQPETLERPAVEPEAEPRDGPSDDASMELMRQLRASAQLQHGWIAQAWNAEPGIHPAAGMLLSELAHRGESRPSELAKRRMVDLSVISRQISQLAAAGLIERRPAPEDGRAALIRVSDQGKAQLERWRGLYIAFVKRALGNWTDEDVDALTRRLELMNEDLRDALGGCPAQDGKK